MNISYSITSKHQVTLPKEVRETLGITNGQSVRFVRQDNKYFLEAAPTVVDAQQYNASIRHHKAATQRDIDAARTKFDEAKLTW